MMLLSRRGSHFLIRFGRDFLDFRESRTRCSSWRSFATRSAGISQRVETRISKFEYVMPRSYRAKRNALADECAALTEKREIRTRPLSTDNQSQNHSAPMQNRWSTPRTRSFPLIGTGAAARRSPISFSESTSIPESLIFTAASIPSSRAQ